MFTEILLRLCFVRFSLKDIFHERAWLKTNIFSVQVRVSYLVTSAGCSARHVVIFLRLALVAIL